jgi:hypothetical protein
MSNMDEYSGRVQAIVWRASAYVSNDGIGRVQQLVDHGEPAEGMLSLAWIIVKEGVQVPRDLIQAIREHAAGLVDDELLPADLDTHGATEQSPNEP